MSCTVLFDGNNFLHRTFHVSARIKESFSKVPLDFNGDPETDRNILLSKLATDFVSEARKFSKVADQIVYCIDAQSWRKLAFPLEAYKGTRKREASINWNGVFDAHEQFVASLAEHGVHISRSQGAEADDLIFNWCNSLNHWGSRNCIIISGDNDLLQLVSKDDSSGHWTIYYNKFDRFFKVFPSFNTWLAEQPKPGSLFDLGTFAKDEREDLQLIIKGESGIDTINATEYIFSKILLGDSGDNVPPVYSRTKQTKAGEKTFKFSDKMAREVLNDFKSKASTVFVNQFHLFDDQCIRMIAELAIQKMKIDDRTVDELMERWKTNRDMLFLHHKCIPSYVLENMNKDYEAGKSSRINKSMTKESVLAKTDWFDWQAVGGPIKTSNEPDTVIKEEHDPKGGFDRSKWDLFK